MNRLQRYIKERTGTVFPRGFYNPPRKKDLSEVHYQINDRAAFRRMIDSNAIDGQVALHREGVDCDGTWYYEVHNIVAPVSVVAFLAEEDKRIEYLDGPERNWFGPPVEEEGRAIRDLALEAFEDGHPGVLYPPTVH